MSVLREGGAGEAGGHDPRGQAGVFWRCVQLQILSDPCSGERVLRGLRFYLLILPSKVIHCLPHL